MATNFNFSVENGTLKYKDSKNNNITLGSSGNIAPEYSKTTYAAKSLVSHNGKLYYNANAIGTAENWTAAHWTECTVASYIAVVTA